MDEISTRTSPHWRPVNLTTAQAKYPQFDNPDLPRNYFVGLFVGARNSGKTFSCVELIKQMEASKAHDKQGIRVKVRTIVISPTAYTNTVFTSLNSLSPEDIHIEYSDDLIREIIEDIKAKKEEAEAYHERLRIYKKMLKMRSLNDMEIEELWELDKMGYMPPEKPEYETAPITNLILDDLIGSNAFRNGRSPVMNLILRNRHVGGGLNIFICTQAMRQVPKAIRNNANVFAVYKYANAKMVVDDIYDEVSNLLTEAQFQKLYEYATDGEGFNRFLFIDFTKAKPDVFRKGFNTFIQLK